LLTDRSSTAIFVIDSDESVRRALRRLLRSHGYCNILSFANPVEFLASPDLKEPGCVIAGGLPPKEGSALPKALRAHGLSLPVILLSALDSEDARARAKEGGVSACFLKPVDDQALIDAIDWALTAAPLGVSPSTPNPGGKS
jgi:FixJ family two-component response regulator